MAKTLKSGDAAPAISLLDQHGDVQSLADRRGRWVLVYFYPRDDTPGCTVEACGVRDAWGRFGAAGIDVLGISADNVKSHKRFADKFALPFTLLADEQKAVVNAYGAWGKKKFMGREFDGILRQSFLVDPAGKIAKVYPKVKPDAHAEEVLADVAALAGGASPASAPEVAKPAKKAPAKKAAPAKAKAKATARPAKAAKAAAKPAKAAKKA
jgi:peroxiredoxin Q/BCP